MVQLVCTYCGLKMNSAETLQEAKDRVKMKQISCHDGLMEVQE